MTVTVQEPITQTTANGVTDTFPFGFKVLSADDLVVELDDLEQSSGFTVNDVGEETGSVTFSSTPASGVVVKMYRDMEPKREADYQNSGDFLARSVNVDFDRLWLYVQQLLKFFSRTFRAPVGEELSTLPSAEQRANKVLGFDENGDTSVTTLDEAVQGAAETFVEDVQELADTATTQAGIATTQAGIATTQATAASGSANAAATSETNASASETAAADSESSAEQYALQAAANGHIYASTTAAQSNGVNSLTSLVAGSGGTDGTFDLIFTGGAGSNAAGRFTVASGAVVSTVITNPGTGYTSAPTVDFSNSSGLSGASATAVLAENRPSGTYYLIPLSTGNGAARYYLNNSGTPYTEDDWIVPNLSEVLSLLPISQSAYSAAYSFYEHLEGRFELVYDSSGNLRIFSEISPSRGSIIYSQVREPDSGGDGITTIYEFEGYPDYIKSIRDTDGAIRLLEVRGANYAGQVFFGAESDIPSVYPFDGYPDYVKAVRDSNGQIRVLEARGENYSGPVFFGANSTGSGAVEIPYVFYLFLVAGQSNAKGTGEGEFSPSVPAGIAYWWDNDSSELVHLEDPSPVSSSTAGSAWPAFSNRFNEITGAGVIVVNAAVGSSAQTVEAAPAMSDQHWDDSGALRSDAVSQLNSAISYLESNGVAYQFGGVLWSQGEREANAIDDATISDAANYKTVFSEMLDYFRTEFDRPNMRLVLSQTGFNDGGETTGFEQIQAAQAELVNELDYVYMGYSGAKTAPSRGQMKDELHYKQPIYNEMGKSMAVTAAAHCVGQI